MVSGRGTTAEPMKCKTVYRSAIERCHSKESIDLYGLLSVQEEQADHFNTNTIQNGESDVYILNKTRHLNFTLLTLSNVFIPFSMNGHVQKPNLSATKRDMDVINEKGEEMLQADMGPGRKAGSEQVAMALLMFGITSERCETLGA